MMYLKWLVLAFASLFFDVVVYLFAPILPAFAQSSGYLPNWLCWLGQWDNSLDGDAGWNDPVSHPTVNKLPRYVRRILWLWRNPAQGFDYWRASATIAAADVRVIHGNPLVSNNPYVSGWCFATVGGVWMLYICLPTFPGMCLRVYVGYALQDCIQSGGADIAQVKISANPFMTRTA